MCHASANQTVCRVSGCNFPIAIDEKRGIRHGYCSIKCARASGETIRADQYAVQAKKEKAPVPAINEALNMVSYMRTLVERVKEDDHKRAVKAKEEEDLKKANKAKKEEARKLEIESKKAARRLERDAKAAAANSAQQAQGPAPPQLSEQQNVTHEFTPVRLLLSPEAASEGEVVFVHTTNRV
ncbi:hypothetical protein EMPS_04683 [Entomortierella parvispora]|uniref:Uncharacterized protein n=1 Tax=Entomortierella parvispora TaxID=205924 RepID=A0A9P3LVM7_9FUNG|nr:hypothetical protein EMPS_04683 [Entomortierella parvispora]